MDQIKNDKSKKKENLVATYAFQLWNEFTTKLRRDPLTDRFVTRIAGLRFEIKKLLN